MDSNVFLLGILLGLAGQGARLVIDMEKEVKNGGKKWSDWFGKGKQALSFVTAAIAGWVAALYFFDPAEGITKSLLLGIAAAGYAGVDFLSGLFKAGGQFFKK